MNGNGSSGKNTSSTMNINTSSNQNKANALEFLPTGGKSFPSAPCRCNYCHIDITQYLRIVCNECVSFSLCADCYCSGVELFPHKPTHSYRIVDCLHYPIFHKEWTIAEELLLLEGIEKHGIGNWKTISDYVGTKTARACGDHYWHDYFGKFGSCLPSQTISLEQQTQIETSQLLFPGAPSEEQFVNVPSSEMLGLPISDYFQLIAEDLPEPPPTSSSQGTSKLRESLSTSRREQEIREKLAALPGAEVAGYMPLREDFDTEHNNDAEHLLVDMEFLPDDHPSERAMKLKVIEIYNQKLTERDERKKFVIERGIIDVKKQQQAEKKRSKEERDLIGRLKIFSRFLSAEEYDALVDGIVDMKRLKRQLECYRLYRSMGIRTVEQARKFETERKKREYQMKAQKSRQSSNYLPFAENGTTSGLNFSNSTPTTSGIGNGDTQQQSNTNVTTRRAQSLSSSSSPIPFDQGGGAGSGGDSRTSQSRGGEIGARVEVPRSFRSAPGAQLLSELELELCAKTQLFPLQYIAILEAVVRESYRNGCLTVEGFHRVVRTDLPSPASRLRGTKRSHSATQADDTSGDASQDLTSSFTPAGLSSAVADVLFDFFVEHTSKANPAQSQIRYEDYLKRYQQQTIQQHGPLSQQQDQQEAEQEPDNY